MQPQPRIQPIPQTKQNAAIFYTMADFRTSGEKLMGRNAASESFLQGFARHAGVDDFFCFTSNQAAFADFTQRIAQMVAPRRAVCQAVTPGNTSALASAGCLFIPDPSIARFAWQRRAGDQRAYSLCGVTHTISSQGSMDLLGSLMTAPVQPWDAVICTSTVVKQSVEYMLGNLGEYFAARLGAKVESSGIRLPVIPLGINCSDFDPGEKRQQYRDDWRKKLGIAEGDIAVLFVGRLSFHAKAHPTPMYIALERAAKQTGKRLHLIQAGWFANNAIENSFKQGAKELCPSVNAIFVDGRDLAVRKEIWFASDIFTSLSDNIQETFGITPLEAMAAGLPVVVTDWNGYRDNVRNGIDGITVPTLAPPPGMGKDLAFRFETEIDNYDLYIGNACQGTSVDIEASTKAYVKLIENPDLRQRMGEEGKRRANEIYDWKPIIAAYQELWGELASIRKNAEEIAPRKISSPSNPLRDDPFALFASYPTTALNQSDMVTLLQVEPEAYYKKTYELGIHKFGWLPSEALCIQIITTLKESGASCQVSSLLSKIPANQHALATRAIIGFAKIGLVSVAEHNV